MLARVNGVDPKTADQRKAIRYHMPFTELILSIGHLRPPQPMACPDVLAEIICISAGPSEKRLINRRQCHHSCDTGPPAILSRISSHVLRTCSLSSAHS